MTWNLTCLDGIDSGSMEKGENEYVEKGTNYLLLELEQIKKIIEEWH